MKHLHGKFRRFAGLLLAVLLLLGALPLAGCGGSKSSVGTSSEAVSAGSVPVSAVSEADPPEDVSRSVTFSDNNKQDEPDAEDAGTGSELTVSDEAAWSDSETASETETGTGTNKTEDVQESAADDTVQIDEHGSYTSKEEVALYLHTYGHLPENYITKKQAEKLGWDNRAGNLQDVAPGKSIGGSRFGNYEGLLPDAKGRNYYECDINYEGGYRGAERIIYSDDGLIFYTADHYKSFEQLY